MQLHNINNFDFVAHLINENYQYASDRFYVNTYKRKTLYYSAEEKKNCNFISSWQNL